MMMIKLTFYMRTAISNNQQETTLFVRVLLVLCFCTCSFVRSHAQLYLEAVGGITPYDICNCAISGPQIGIGSVALATGSNLNPYYSNGLDVFMYDLATNSSILIATLPEGGNGMVYGSDGFLYVIGYSLAGVSTLFAVNPATGNVQNLGDLPAGFLPIGDLFFYNGSLYATAELNLINGIFQIPLSNPSAASITHQFNNFSAGVGTAMVTIDGVQTLLINGSDANGGALDIGIYAFDMVTGTYTLLCPTFLQIFDIAAPPGFSVNCCGNFAGSFSNYTPVNLCGNSTFNLTHNGNEVLNPGSILRYILVSDSLAPLPNAVIAVSATPSFTFNPATMSFNTPYYVAAIATPDNNGTPDWQASCKDLTTFIPVIWRPIPSVAFSVPNPAVCAGDCRNITATFAGTPPFTLNYTTPSGGAQSQVFPTSTGTIQVCLPANAPVGNFQITATSLTDNWCTCTQ
jgi:hypothetical protein